MSPELAALAAEAVEAGNARLDGRLTREEHARIIARIDTRLTELDASWEELTDLGNAYASTQPDGDDVTDPTPEATPDAASLPRMTAKELEAIGKKWQAARERERALATELYAALQRECAAGMTEVEAARLAGVDRMTVRRALGKR